MKKRIPAILLALCLALSLLPMAALAADSRQITQVQANLDSFGVYLGSPLPQATTKTPHVILRTEWRYWPTQGGPMFQDMEPVTGGTASKAGCYWAQVTVIPDSGYSFAPDCGFIPSEGLPSIPLAGSNPYLYAVMVDRSPVLNALSLSSGTLQPNFSPSLFGTYYVDVAGEIDSITVTAAAQPGFTIQGDGARSLNPGENRIEITVTDDLGQHQPNTYTICVNRAQPHPVSVPSFTDVPAGQFYTAADTDMDAAVEWAKDKGMIDGAFERTKPCTRATAVSYIWQALGRAPAKASGFTDVPAGSDYAAAVDWALANGVTNGTTDTTFGPGEVCSRGQIVTFLHRAYVESARLSVN